MENTTNTNSAIDNINAVFSKLVNSIDQNVFNSLDKLVFIDEKILSDKATTKLLGETYTEGTISIAITIAIGIIFFYGFKYLISHLTFEQVEQPSAFLFKITLTLLFITGFKELAVKVLEINSYITEDILNISSNFFKGSIDFKTLIKNINSNMYKLDSDFDFISFDGIIKFFVTIGMFGLLLEYAFRYVMIKLMLIIAPIILVIGAFKSSKYITVSWYKTIFATLMLQNFVAIILVTTTMINIKSDEMITKLIFVGTIYALMKSNHLASQIFGGVSLGGGGFSNPLMKGKVK